MILPLLVVGPAHVRRPFSCADELLDSRAHLDTILPSAQVDPVWNPACSERKFNAIVFDLSRRHSSTAVPPARV